jgi:hypothetical protein
MLLKTAILGFVAAAISVFTFHQAMWEALHLLALPGLGMPPAYPTGGTPPWGVPKIISLAFWGGLYGIVFALIRPKLTIPTWFGGLIMGLIATLVGFLIVPALQGHAIGGGWNALLWLKVCLINGFWGIGLGIILPLLDPVTRRPAIA